jgi:DNA modification methylase
MSNQPHLMDIDPEEQLSEEEKAKKVEYCQRLVEKLNDPEFRIADGFPIGDDEAILALSDLPYYTVCPNPFLDEIIEVWQIERAETQKKLDLAINNDEKYNREPFAADVSEGKNDPIYNAHTYHTKVPYKAILHYILHYTQPGDIVLDGFAGTGMTGVAAQLCGNEDVIRSSGYAINNSKVFKGNEEISYLGSRKAFLIDLSPIATFISHNNNFPASSTSFYSEAWKIIKQAQAQFGSYYTTTNDIDGNKSKNETNYYVWSNLFICPNCLKEMSFWEAGIKLGEGITTYDFKCPHCNTISNKSDCEYAYESIFDPILERPITTLKRKLVLVNYSIGTKRYRRDPNESDLMKVERIKSNLLDFNQAIPVSRMPEGDESRRNDHFGITHVHHFYTPRNLAVLSFIWQNTNNPELSKNLQNSLKFWVTSIIDRNAVIRNRFVVNSHNPNGRINGPMQNTLYCPDLFCEVNIIKLLEGKLEDINRSLQIKRGQGVTISTSSSSSLSLPDDSIDYIFVDPPFGKNIYYSELNFITESWLGVTTKNESEGVINDTQEKGLREYQQILEECYDEFFRVLKPSHWITTEFHNSKNSVWIAIQEAISKAGFIIAGISTLDKISGTIHQDTSAGSVRQDLVISAYKPSTKFSVQFETLAGTKKGAWSFTREHLANLPIVISDKGKINTILERKPYLLFDRMVAFHIQKGIAVPLSANEFYIGLKEKFVDRDGMVFLSDQVTKYDQARLNADEVVQLALFVKDEKTAIQWLSQILNPDTGGSPQTYQEIQPHFLQQLQQSRHEQLPELLEVLEQNFLQDEQDKWYVPDPKKASDLEKIRNKALLREFNKYLKGNKKLKQFRTEAVRAGFADAWQHKDFEVIVRVAERLPETIIQEDPDLLMYYDNASLRVD